MLSSEAAAFARSIPSIGVQPAAGAGSSVKVGCGVGVGAGLALDAVAAEVAAGEGDGCDEPVGPPAQAAIVTASIARVGRRRCRLGIGRPWDAGRPRRV